MVRTKLAEDIAGTDETRQAPALASSNVPISAAVSCSQTQLCFVLRKTSFFRSANERVLAPDVYCVLSRWGGKTFSLDDCRVQLRTLALLPREEQPFILTVVAFLTNCRKGILELNGVF